jgi:hypothetical protein
MGSLDIIFGSGLIITGFILLPFHAFTGFPDDSLSFLLAAHSPSP